MSGETVLRMQPGESIEDFSRRVVDSAPDAPPHVMDRLRGLLVPSLSDAELTELSAHQQLVRTAA